MESDYGRTPTFEEFKESFASASRIAREKFPEASVTEYEDEHYRVGFELVESLSKQIERDTRFLMSVAPLIESPVRSSEFSKVESEILDNARREELDLKSLTVVTVLSCLYDNGSSGFSPARNLINPPSQHTKIK